MSVLVCRARCSLGSGLTQAETTTTPWSPCGQGEWTPGGVLRGDQVQLRFEVSSSGP